MIQRGEKEGKNLGQIVIAIIGTDGWSLRTMLLIMPLVRCCLVPVLRLRAAQVSQVPQPGYSFRVYSAKSERLLLRCHFPEALL